MIVVNETVAGSVGSGNSYFTPPDPLPPVTKARAVDINNLTAAVSAAFQKFPDTLAIKDGTINYAVDTSTSADQYQVAISADVTAYRDGLMVRMRPTRDNLGPASINVNGLGPVSIKRLDGVDVQAGDIIKDATIALSYVAAKNAFVLPNLAGSQILQAASNAATAASSASAAAGSASAANASATAAAGSASTASTKAAAAAQSASDAAGYAASAQSASSGQVQADWNMATTTDKSYIKNKPVIVDTALTGYAIAGTVSALAATDTIKTAFGKVQKALDAKADAASVMPKTGGTFTGPVNAAQGSATAPGLTFNPDTDTGLYGMADGAIGIAANGLKIGEMRADGFRFIRPVAFDCTGVTDVAVNLFGTGPNGVQVALWGNGSNPNKRLRLINGTLDILNDSGATQILTLTDAGTLSAPVVTQTSDENKKQDWQRVEAGFVEKLAAIDKAGTYRWKDGGALACGIGAQSLEAILPSAVYTGADDTKQVNTGGAAMVMCAELARELVALRAELNQIKERI